MQSSGNQILRAFRARQFTGAVLHPNVTSNLVSQLHDLGFFQEAFENYCPELAQFATHLQTELVRLGLRPALTLLYSDLNDAKFWEHFDDSWV